jgi:type I restriction-modification system DNA methylase subunit
LTLINFPRKLIVMASNFDEAFAAVKSLAKDFDAQKNFYLSPKYQEAEVRKEFIDKFLIALGWDVNHDEQKNPYEQEVKIERKEHGVSTRRADYAFYLTPNFRDVKFYIEAKKPFGDIATPDNYFQTIRYGWSSKTKIAALFDFEQFEIVDCRFKPDLKTALQRNLKRFKYTEYADQEKFAEIYWLFSREAVAGGSLEKYAETLPKSRGTVQRGDIDDSFLEDLDAYRDTLAHIFKNSNPKLDGESLTEATQRTLDRLVFIRFLEDKLIEPQHIVARFGERGSAWGDFIAASRRLDGIYNGIVFKKNDILDTPSFKVDDEQFSGICKKLSHVNSAYDFNAIPIHILGSIYERFLGKVIVATDKRARVEEKPEVRKAGGVYYTPEYIVRYIVENTVGKLIEGKSPAQIAEMKFADIACGSGSFLLGVYDLLIRYHTKFYNENPAKAKKGDVMKREDGLHLSLQKKREILVNNLYGVDIDNQAVEVAQLSLYLKLLQDETPGSTRQYILDFEQQALLPTLNKNIVCGNSLIGTDILSGELFEPVEEQKLNPMDFEDRFPQIFRRRRGDESQTLLKDKSETPHVVSYDSSGGELRDAAPGELDYTMPGVPLHGSFSYKKSKKDKTIPPPALPESEYEGGFDAIVGNPPWISLSGKFGNEFLPPVAQNYLISRHGGNTYMPNMYEYFVARGLELTKTGGLFGYIVPDRLGFNSQFVQLRKRILTGARIQSLQYKVPFPGITADTLVFIFNKGLAQPSHEVEISEYGHPPVRRKQTELISRPEYRFEYKIDTQQDQLAQKLETTSTIKPLSEVVSCTSGFGGKSQLITETQLRKAQIKTLKGDSIGRYQHRRGYWFEFKRENITGRTTDKEKLGASPKILIRKTGDSIIATLDDSGIFPEQSLYFLFGGKTQMDFKYLLGLINSNLMNWFFKKTCLTNEKSIAQVKTVDLVKLPIRIVDFSNLRDKARHDKLVSLVEQMLAAKPQLARAQSDKEKDFYENKCAALDRQIDALVYELYSLNADEIKIVEGSAK